MSQSNPTPETQVTFRMDVPDLTVETFITCKLADLPTHLWHAVKRVNDLTIGQAPMMIEIRRID